MDAVLKIVAAHTFCYLLINLSRETTKSCST